MKTCELAVTERITKMIHRDTGAGRYVTSKARLVTLLAVLGAAMLGACRQDDSRPPAPPDPMVRVIHPQRGAMTMSVELPGDLVGFYEAALHAKVTGYLKSMAVDKGDRVRADQVLAIIEVPELDSNLARARANLAIQRITYERIKRVQESDKRLVAQQDVDAAYAAYRQAQAAVQTLETMVGYTKIVAPFDGVITGRFADPGAVVRAGGGDIGVDESSALISPGATEGAGGHRTGGGPILTIARLDKLRVYVYVPGQWCHYIRQGTPATLSFDEVPGYVVSSSVTRYASALDLTTRTMLVEIDIANPGSVLYPRMYARVKLDLLSHPHALRLPARAVGNEAGRTVVFTVRNGRLVRTPVSTGIIQPNYAEITSGLTTDDLVVSVFSTELSDGEIVRYTIESPGSTQARR
jgi:membrane fusion protein (multidrug efflux system)